MPKRKSTGPISPMAGSPLAAKKPVMSRTNATARNPHKVNMTFITFSKVFADVLLLFIMLNLSAFYRYSSGRCDKLVGIAAEGKFKEVLCLRGKLCVLLCYHNKVTL